MRFTLRTWAILLLTFVFVSLSSAHAQNTSATLSGTVKDASGAVIPQVKINLTDTDTGLTQNITSSDSGNFVLTPLPPGHYTITAERDGFRRQVQSGILLTVAQEATLNLTLEIGSTSETVSVDAMPEIINATSPDLSTIVDARAIEELPLNGRDPSSLVLLAPGMTNGLRLGSVLQATNSFPGETGASSGGGRSGSAYFLLDGVPNMDTYNLLAAPFPNADATQEFRVTTNNFDARYGFAPGAVVSIQTKSGTNKFHGGLFEFIRNNDLNAGNWFNKSIDTLKRNQFGAFLGGPIRSDKLFFFANYQGTRSVSSSAGSSTFTPTAAMLNGDFTALLAGSTPQVLKNYPTNKIPVTDFSPGALALVKNVPLGQTPTTGQVFYSSPVTRSTLNEGTGRLDYTINDRQRVSVRSFIDRFSQPQGAIPGNIVTGVLGDDGRYWNAAVNHIWTLSPKMVNSFSGAWIRMDFVSGAQQLGANGQPTCLSQYVKISDPANGCFLVGLSISNGFSTPFYENNTEKRATVAITDAITRNTGNHLLSFGVDAYHQYAREYSLYPANANVSFNGYYTGYGLADFLLGKVSTLLQGAGETQQLAGWQLGVYAQDQYKVRPNFTLTAGLRWEPNLAPNVKDGRGTAFVPGQKSTRFPNAPVGLVFPGDTGVTDSLMPASYLYFNPRVGFAWQPAGLQHTSVRAAFGLFTTPISYINYNHTADAAPFSPTFTLAGSAANPISFDNPWASFTGGVNPFPPFTFGTQPTAAATFLTPLTVGTSFSRNFRLAVTQSWNFSVEQQFTRDIAIHLAYVGSESYHQLTPVERNPGICGPVVSGACSNKGARTTYPLFASITEYNTAGTANYQSLQAGVEKRLRYGLQLQSNFTWSKTFDVATLGTNSLSSVPNPFDIRYNRGLSDQNVPYTLVTHFVYTTSKLERHNQLIRQTLGGWQLSGIWQAASGKPFSIAGGNGNNNSGSQVGRDRADVTGRPYMVHQGTRANWLQHYYSTAAFKTNAVGTFGNSQRNLFNANWINSWDMGAAKNWTVHEGYVLQFRWEAFNAFNHPTFSSPNTNPTSSTGGQITSLSSTPRVMQGALKLTF